MAARRSPSAASSTASACSPTASTSPASATRGSARSTPGGDRSSNSASPASPSSTTSGQSEQLLLDPSMSSPAASPARASRLRASAPDSSTPKPFCGERCSEPFASFDPATSLWRTSRISFDFDHPEGNPEISSERFSEAFPRSGSMLSGTAYRQRPSAPLTDVIGSSPLLGTPTAHPRTHSPRPVDHGAQLANETVKLLPTPHGMAKDGQARNAGPTGNELGHALTSGVKLLPTPTAGDAKQARNATANRLNPDSKHHSGTTLSDVAHNWAEESSSTGQSSDQPSNDGKGSSGLRLHPLILRYSNEGDTVLDPFSGLGTVPVRALALGRRGVGVELNGGYFLDAVKYLEAQEREQSMPSLFDALEGEEVAA